ADAPSTAGRSPMDSANSMRWCWLCSDDPQKPRLRISSGRNPGDDAALYNVTEEPALHWRHPRQTAGCAGGTEEGSCHSSTERIGTPALVETERMAEGACISRPLITATGHGEGIATVTG